MCTEHVIYQQRGARAGCPRGQAIRDTPGLYAWSEVSAPDESDKAPEAVQACCCGCDGEPVLLEDILCDAVVILDYF